MAKSELRRLRRDLSAPGLLRAVRKCFDLIGDEVNGRKFSLSDCLMSAVAMFMFKYPSMLSFDESARGADCSRQLHRNLKRLFSLAGVPSDTTMRERLDRIDPQSLRPAFKALFARFQRGGGLRQLEWSLGGYLPAIDGTEFFSSRTVKCGSCCVRVRRGGAAGYFHQMVAACLVSPLTRAVLPLMPEMVTRGDGSTKNDCETNAVKRLLRHIRREHPHLDVTVLMDGLHSKGPQVRLLRELGMSYIIGAKPGDHGVLYGQLDVDGEELVIRKDDGRTLIFRWRNGAELNDSCRDLWVNVLCCEEHVPERRVRKGGGKTRIVPESVRKFCWITDHEINPGNLETIMEAGRSRWQVENGLFKTLKCQGYELEHSYGHGKRHLACCLATVTMLVFMIDKIQEICCAAFQAAMAKVSSKTSLWRIMSGALDFADLPGWERLFQTLIDSRGPEPPAPA